jgi:bacillithiol system protein YtxJ
MDWISLEAESQLKDIIEHSAKKPQLIFKHSTRCSVSSMAKGRLTKNTLPEGVDFYYLDLLKHRDISNKIALNFGIEHKSPQVLLIKDGKCVYTESHSGITMEEIEEMATA